MRGEEIANCKSHIASVSLTNWCIMILKKNIYIIITYSACIFDSLITDSAGILAGLIKYSAGILVPYNIFCSILAIL